MRLKAWHLIILSWSSTSQLNVQSKLKVRVSVTFGEYRSCLAFGEYRSCLAAVVVGGNYFVYFEDEYILTLNYCAYKMHEW